jgi:hypothetical protein
VRLFKRHWCDYFTYRFEYDSLRPQTGTDSLG